MVNLVLEFQYRTKLHGQKFYTRGKKSRGLYSCDIWHLYTAELLHAQLSPCPNPCLTLILAEVAIAVLDPKEDRTGFLEAVQQSSTSIVI